ncbi:HAD family hydrolase [Chloroflexota bacterium]
MPEHRAKAVIWDMDGVIADTAPYHLRAWQHVFHKRGVSFPEEDFKHHFGQRNDTIIRSVLGEQVSLSEVEAIAGEKESAFRKALGHKLKPLPGAINLLKAQREHGFKIALASSAPIENIRMVTRGIGVNNCFHSVVTGRDVAEGKPSPQGFLLAARKLGVDPGRCIVIEDAVAGVAAAKRSGMLCIAVTNTQPRESLMEADLIVESLEEVTVAGLVELIDAKR